MMSKDVALCEDKEAKRNHVAQNIKSYPDFPKPGILFRDMFPLLRNPSAFKDCISLFVDDIKQNYPQTDVIVGLESRGFLFAPLIALELGISFVPVRKAGKLPGEKFTYSYTLEYGTDTVEIAKESIKPGQNVVIVDDLLATGGTLAASIELLGQAKANIKCCMVLMELCELGGRKKLNVPIHTILAL